MSAITSQHPAERHISHSARGVHFVGSLPRELHPDDRSAMRWMLDQSSGIPLRTLPCDRDPDWVTSWLYQLAERNALTPIRDGDSTSYDDYPHYRVAAGKCLAPEDVSLRRASEATAVMGARRGLDNTDPLPPMQVSIPNPLDLAYICFGAPLQLMSHLGAFRQALVDDVEEIHQRFGDDAVFQIETPTSLIALGLAPRALRPMTTAFLAGHIVRLIIDTPREARWILHLCHGDLNHEPVVIPRDLGPAVGLVRAVHRRLTRLGEALPPVHIPMCTGITGPPTDPAFYRALAQLPHDIEVIAGLADEHHPAESRRALDLAENALGRRVTAVAAACGHGRRSPAETADNAALTRELATAPFRPFATHRGSTGDPR